MSDDVFRLQEEVDRLRFELGAMRQTIAANVNAIASRHQADDIVRKVAPEIRAARQEAYLEVRDAILSMHPDVVVDTLKAKIAEAGRNERRRTEGLIDRLILDESTAPESDGPIRALRRLKARLLARPDGMFEPKGVGSIEPRITVARNRRPLGPLAGVIDGLEIAAADRAWARDQLSEGKAKEEVRAELQKRIERRKHRKALKELDAKLIEGAPLLAEDEEFRARLLEKERQEEEERRIKRLDANFVTRMRKKGHTDEEIREGLVARALKRAQGGSEDEEKDAPEGEAQS